MQFISFHFTTTFIYSLFFFFFSFLYRASPIFQWVLISCQWVLEPRSTHGIGACDRDNSTTYMILLDDAALMVLEDRAANTIGPPPHESMQEKK